MRDLRGNRIAMIFQDPMMTLNPVLRIDTQMIETMQAHEKVGRRRRGSGRATRSARSASRAPTSASRAYPHQFSGGMRQRVAIAIALLHEPDLIVADEPTTALDVTIQGQILAEVQKLCRETGTALIWITHDLSVVAGLADDIAVMYAGRVVEKGPSTRCWTSPLHPYTVGLIGSVPSRNHRGEPLRQIPGHDALPARPARRLRLPRPLPARRAALRQSRRRWRSTGPAASPAASTPTTRSRWQRERARSTRCGPARNSRRARR